MLELYFGSTKGVPNVPLRATFKNCTLCIIKPHAITEGNLGSILEHISTTKNLYISAMAMFTVNLDNAEEFYEVYKEVIPEYKVDPLTNHHHFLYTSHF